MRRMVISLVCLVFLLAACGSDKKEALTTTTGTTPVSSAATATTSPTPTSSATTTTGECPNTGSTGVRNTPEAQPTALLTKVAVTTTGCRDRVVFEYKSNGNAPPSCKIEYRAGPFVQDASGAPVTIAGSAFVVVRCFPADVYDFETSRATYAGPKRIDPTGTRHVRELVETGSFEAVLNWVIGLDAKRPFAVSTTGMPTRQLVITFT